MVQHNDYSLVTKKYHLYPKVPSKRWSCASFKDWLEPLDYSEPCCCYLDFELTWIFFFKEMAEHSFKIGWFSSPFSVLMAENNGGGEAYSGVLCSSSHWQQGSCSFNSRSFCVEFASPPCVCVGSLNCPKACKLSELATLNCLLWTSVDSCLSICVGPAMSWWFVQGITPPSPSK